MTQATTTASRGDFTDPASLPTHYRDDPSKGVCSWSGTIQGDNICPDGCSFADHYGNDGHEACADE